MISRLRGLGRWLLLALFLGPASPLPADGLRLDLVGNYLWQPTDPEIGGLSGLELSEDGQGFIAIGDRGIRVDGILQRDDEDRIRAVEPKVVQRLRDTKGAPMEGPITDSEGLAIGKDGRVYVSFEGQGRVWAYATPKTATALPVAPAFRKLGGNSGLEALAIDASGALYTMPERSGLLGRPFPVWRYENGSWSQPFSLPRRDRFLISGADFGPDGWLYILEREFNGLGFRSRVRRFQIQNDHVVAEQQLLETVLFQYGNLEGISVWRDAGGFIRLTMISDDNYMGFLPMQFVEYRLEPQ